MIVTDDQRAETLEVMTGTRQHFAEEGTSFPNAFAVTPQCCPSRASIFSGRYPHNHGVVTNADADLLDETATVQSYLRDAGYRTAIIGKHLNRPGPYEDPDLVGIDPQGFDEWAIFLGGYEDPTFNIDGDVRVERGYSTDLIRDRAVGFVERSAGQDDPWLLFVTPFAPHMAYIPSPRHTRAPVPPWHADPAEERVDGRGKPRYVRAAPDPPQPAREVRREQLRTLMAVDELIVDVVDALRTTGQEDSTLAVFTSDQGHLWGEHGIVDKGPPYLPSVKVPLLMRWPGRVEAGAVDDRLVSLVDLAPTFLEAAGVTAPDDPPIDGRSLLRDAPRERILLQHRGLRRIGMPPWASLVTRTAQYTEYYDGSGALLFREYYDLERDPSQLHNLIADGESEPRARELSLLLEQDFRCAGPTCP